ncbi:MAG TPA: flagellin [Verrucomicrobiae bacterium]
MVINTNISAINSASQLGVSTTNLQKSLAKLSSGSKIVSPSDDSAGLAVSMKLNAQINRVNAAQSNVANAISLNQTQDGYLSKVNDAFNRMSELTVLAQDVTKTTSDRALYQQEFSTLQTYVSDVSTKDFNGVSLFNGNTLSVTTDSDGNTFSNTGVDLNGGSTYTTATGSSTSIDTVAHAQTALTNIKNAISQLASDRANIGANEESLGYYNAQLGTLSNNLSAAKSQITDVDVAQESTNYAKSNILVQSGTAMLAQANSLPQSVLRLLG